MSDTETIARVARAICAEKCTYYGDPPCWEVGEGLSPDCDEPGCEALAMAAVAAMADDYTIGDLRAAIKDMQKI